MKIEVFNRVETKYILNEQTYQALVNEISAYMEPDSYCQNGEFYTICNIYYDTATDELIRHSLEKPVYKEKLRLRSYGIAGNDDMVFLEIKKKYKGVVNKRRTSLKVCEANEFVLHSIRPKHSEYINEQVLDELSYFIKFYKPVPKVFISYDRRAFFGKDDMDFRITFDKNIGARRNDLKFDNCLCTTKILNDNQYLMEVKVKNAYPLWLTKLFTKYNINRCSFSKYGTEYKKMNQNINK